MISDAQEYFNNLKQAVVDLDEERVIALCKAGLQQKCSPLDIVNNGLSIGMSLIGDFYAQKKMILPHLVIGAEVMKAGLKILEPELLKSVEKPITRGNVLIGTVEGDIHDIGKGIVAVILTASGYAVKDLGASVPNETFIQEVKTNRYDFLCMSALMTTTIVNQEMVVNRLKKEGIRDKIYVIVGGSAVTRSFAEKIGADGYGEAPQEAIELMDRLMEKKTSR